MALIIDLKPQERIIIGNALITNDASRARLHIEGEAPILREKDIMREEEANSPCKRIYFTIQMMYLAADPAKMHDIYFQQIHDIQNAAPSTATFFMKINDFILNNQYYKALKEARGLMEHERELLASV
jgi:flagellar biosynthesis repressor protein FlbT